MNIRGILKKRLLASLICVCVLFYFSTGLRLFSYSLPAIFTSSSLLLLVVQTILVLMVFIINRQIFISGLTSIINRVISIDAPVAVGALVAFLYSLIISIENIIYYENFAEYIGKSDIYFDTSALIIFIASIGRFIEEYAKGKTTDVLADFTDLSPKTAIILDNKKEEKEIPIEDIKVGDIFVAKPGMMIPADGIVESGNSAVDESSLTGEFAPVDKGPGDKVSAATINMSGYMTCIAKEVGANTTFSHIVKMVEEASIDKHPNNNRANKSSIVLAIIIAILSVITFIIWSFSNMGFGFAVSRAIAVLIVSTPVALTMSTSVALMMGNSIGAKHGILYKTKEAIKDTGKTGIVVLDKTGTITTGEPKITDVISTVSDIEHRDVLLTIAYSLESKSEHPLARAICRYAKSRYIEPLPTTNFRAIAGKGITAEININGVNRKIYAGNGNFIAEVVLGKTVNSDEEAYRSDFSDIIDKLVSDGKTPLIFASDKGLIGVIGVADEVKEEAPVAIDALHKEGIHVVMVTGDRYETAKAVGRQIGVGKDEVLSEVLPSEKADIVTKLRQSGRVAMIGDGINDAPALSCADVGIAIGAGTDVAIDAADVVLMSNSLASAVTAIRLSRFTGNIIRENFFFAVILNILGIPFAAGMFYRLFGWILSPVSCALIMVISGIFVTINSLRLFSFKTTIFEINTQEEELNTDDIA